MPPPLLLSFIGNKGRNDRISTTHTTGTGSLKSVRTDTYGMKCTARRGVSTLTAVRYFSAAAVLLFALMGFGTDIHAASPVQGDKMVNTVFVTSATTPLVSAVATVTAVFRTPSIIDYLQYAPTLPGTPAIQVVAGTYRSGASPVSPFLPLPAPIMTGSSTPIDLSSPIPLAPATQIHQGDPLFIRVTDKDQNLDRTLVETVLVTVTNPANGDVEVLRLSETGPDTGIFVAYLPTTDSAAASYNGSITVKAGDTLTTRYVDIVDGSDTSATTIMVDPYGIIFDSATGLPLNGATITMINTATGLPATILGDDGVQQLSGNTHIRWQHQ